MVRLESTQSLLQISAALIDSHAFGTAVSAAEIDPTTERTTGVYFETLQRPFTSGHAGLSAGT